MSIQVKDANGVTQTVATLDDLLQIIATQATSAAILAKLSSDPATQTTLAAVLAALGTNHADGQQLHADIGTTLHGDLGTANTALAAVLTAVTAATPAGEAHVGEVGGNSAVVGGSFARPATTTAYAIGQLVANNATAGSVQAISCPVARKNGGTGVIAGLRLSKSNNSLSNASFRVHLFKTAPTSTVGDLGTFAAAINGVAAIALGYVDVTMDQQYSDGAKGFTTLQKVFDTAAGSQNIFALIEARAAYTPVASETFTVALEVLRD